ncbi:MAG: hypothetical protein ACLQAT_13210 [Candidatus Binataceae bacterium]
MAAILALSMLGAGCGGSSGQSPVAAQADTIYTNANVETMNEAQPAAQAVAIKRTSILAVGSNADVLAFKGPGTTVTDLQGATILPGFIDAHSHLMGYAFFSDTNYWTDCLERKFVSQTSARRFAMRHSDESAELLHSGSDRR